jgi:hypothetical protein
MTELLQSLFTLAVWAVAIGSVLGMTVVPLSLFVEDRIKRGKAVKRL